MQWLYHVIGQVGIFLSCAQTLIHFRPRESYEKYFKLLLSIMLLIQLLQPLLTVLGGDNIAGTDVQAAEFAEEIRTVLEQAAVQAEQTEDEIQAAADTAAEADESPLGEDWADHCQCMAGISLYDECLSGRFAIHLHGIL